MPSILGVSANVTVWAVAAVAMVAAVSSAVTLVWSTTI